MISISSLVKPDFKCRDETESRRREEEARKARELAEQEEGALKLLLEQVRLRACPPKSFLGVETKLCVWGGDIPGKSRSHSHLVTSHWVIGGTCIPKSDMAFVTSQSVCTHGPRRKLHIKAAYGRKSAATGGDHSLQCAFCRACTAPTVSWEANTEEIGGGVLGGGQSHHCFKVVNDDLWSQAERSEAVQLMKRRAEDGSLPGRRKDSFKLGLVVLFASSPHCI